MNTMSYASRWVARILLCCTMVVQGCATEKAPNASTVVETKGSTANQILKEETFIPKGAFSNSALKKGLPITYGIELSDSDKASTIGSTSALTPMVLLYTSPTSKKYYEGTGLNFQVNVRVWELFLNKYKIPFKIINTPDKLEASEPSVLILPSLVALSEREKQAIVRLRLRGGSVLSTWLTGVRDERGAWQGFSFMKTGLGVDVLGDTEAEEEENFMMAYGDTPVLHSLEAGQRVWLQRLNGVYPLRLQGQQSAAQIMNWSRSSAGEKVNTILAFGEQRQTSGLLSRSISVGYSEHLWLSADPKAMEAVAHNALTWLARQPNARLSNWPHPYSGALSIAVDAPEVVDDLDIQFADMVSQIGSKATFYIPTINAAKSAPALRKLQSNGHSVGFMSDRFEGFKGQSETKQASRLDAMLKEFSLANLSTGPTLGFNPPMGSQDNVTRDWINQSGFTYYVTFMSETEGRLPVLIPRKQGVTSTSLPLVMLPRTQNGPEDLMDEGDPEEGLQKYMAEFDSSLAMGGLLLIRFPNQTLLTEDQLDAIFGQFKRNDRRLWSASNGTVSHWWLDRNRVKVDMSLIKGSLSLVVTVDGLSPLSFTPSVTVNLPYANDTLKLVALDNATALSVTPLDPWRVAVALDQLGPGTHRWHMHFERSTP